MDPNDGTRAFIQGHRGSAVSIALAVDGVPVLGVVYAPTAPDDSGDLITWARGEPLRRNSTPMERAPLPAALTSLSVVAMNADAEGRHLASSLALAAPARVRARSSIAYRLALVAVGEADAAVSMSGPTDYDVAGGHALVLGAGGDLVDARGQTVRYGSRATGPTNVFGGHPEVAALLARRAGEAGPSRTARPPAPTPVEQRYPQLMPSHKHKVRDAQRLARAQGALLGQVAGDALGQLVEFESRTQVARAYPNGVRDLEDGGTWNTLAGQPTDDSELALILGRSIVGNGGFDTDVAREAYRAWLASHPFDVGTTTRRGILGESTAHSEANGSAMRISPLAVHLWRNTPDAVASIAVQDAAITHESATCVEATAVLAAAIATAVREGSGPRALYATVAAWMRRQDQFTSGVRGIVAEDDVAPVKDFHTNAGWVLIALRNAFHQLLHAPSFEEGVIRTVSQGGDADTNGAIAGALLGAVYGRDAVPLRWRRTVLTCRAHTGAHPRPATFWATDLLELAERLVALGPLHEPTEEEDTSVASLDAKRAHLRDEHEAREALLEVVRDAIPGLQRAAAKLAVFRGLPMSSNPSPDAHGVSALTRGLARTQSPEAATVGKALELLEELLALHANR